VGVGNVQDIIDFDGGLMGWELARGRLRERERKEELKRRSKKRNQEEEKSSTLLYKTRILWSTVAEFGQL
jgi:hypothetical protein